MLQNCAETDARVAANGSAKKKKAKGTITDYHKDA